jgi:hypothetical protein
VNARERCNVRVQRLGGGAVMARWSVGGVQAATWEVVAAAPGLRRGSVQEVYERRWRRGGERACTGGAATPAMRAGMRGNSWAAMSGAVVQGGRRATDGGGRLTAADGGGRRRTDGERAAEVNRRRRRRAVERKSKAREGSQAGKREI